MRLKDATILIVDDEPDMREILSSVVSSAGCSRVLTAKDGSSALAVIKETHIDCLVTDIRMPGMDGLTLVRRLAEFLVRPLSVVFLSGFSDVDQREMYGLGVEAFLSKPISFQAFLEVVERALAQRSTLWLQPISPAPSQTLSMTLEGGEREDFQLGRGGFSAHYAGALSLGRVAFQLSFPSDQRQIAGEGYVRWRAKGEERLGVEFAFLDEASRSWVVQEISETNPRSFIPPA